MCQPLPASSAWSGRDAFGDQTLWFAVPYVAVRLLNLALYIGGLRHDPVQQRAILALAPWFALSPALALTGAFLGGNIFTGMQQYHSQREWVCVADMGAATETIVHLVGLWA